MCNLFCPACTGQHDCLGAGQQIRNHPHQRRRDHSSHEGISGAIGTHEGVEAPANPFYSNIGSGGYQPYVGWAVCDGVTGCGAEWTPANQIKSLKTGTTKKISLGLGFVQGTNRSLVILTTDCKNLPCTTPDGAPKGKRLCQGTVKNMPIFSDTNTQMVSFSCVAKLTKGKNYWVFIQSPGNSELAWNYSISARAGIVLGENDSWGSYQNQQSTGALTIQ